MIVPNIQKAPTTFPASFPPALLLFCSLSVFASGLPRPLIPPTKPPPPLPVPLAPIIGNAPSVSPLDPAPLPVFWSTYNCEATLSGNAGNELGISAPFCTSSSAIGKAITFGALGPALVLGLVDAGVKERGRGDVAVEEEALVGDAGSVAARARKTEWVFRERSVALGLARRARA